MSYLDELRASRYKPQVAYNEFILYTKQGKNGLFCFFEGKDNAYYVSTIKEFTNKYHVIKCGGREQVLKVHQLINNNSEYDKYKKAFLSIEILMSLYHLIIHQFLKLLVILLKISMFL